MHFIKSLSAALLIAGPAWAFDTDDQARLEQALEAYASSLETSDYKAIVEALPPGVIDLLSEQAKLSPETIRASVAAQLATIMQSATIESFTMDVDAMTSGTTDAGTNYAFLPTTTRITVNGAPIQQANTLTLAIEDDATWHMMRIELDQHYMIFRAAYPEFADVPLPEDGE